MKSLRIGAILLSATFLGSCNFGGDDSTRATAPTTIYAFGGPALPAGDGAEPKGSIGGTGDCGIVFSVNPDGSNYQVLYRFTGADGCDPRHDAMTFDANTARLYSTTQGMNQVSGQTYGNQGQVLSFSPSAPIPAPIPPLWVFNGAPGGAQQHSSFSIDPMTGMLYGQTASGGAHDEGLVYAVSPDGSTFVALHDLTRAQGRNPHGRIVLDGGVLYGIARSDGTTPSGTTGYGAVFSYALTTARSPITAT